MYCHATKVLINQKQTQMKRKQEKAKTSKNLPTAL